MGEDLAVEYLINNNYQVLYRNWKYGRKEVDIIAVKVTARSWIKVNAPFNLADDVDNILHFIEVKTRKNNKNGYPEENVTPAKLRSILTVAEHFLFLNPLWKKVQFDVLAITLQPQTDYYFIEDIYL